MIFSMEPVEMILLPKLAVPAYKPLADGIIFPQITSDGLKI
jgi:hypothetical protein